MPSLNADFQELMERIRGGREYGHASFEPIYYLVFPPHRILEVKRSLPAWEARLKNSGWEVHRFSMAEHVEEIVAEAPQRDIWIRADRKDPQNWRKTNESLAGVLQNGGLRERLGELLDGLKGHDKAMVLVTDLEALHPYMRIGMIEGELYGRFRVPTVILYPGERTGKSRLKFLGFYHEDGNYRSVHIGG